MRELFRYWLANVSSGVYDRVHAWTATIGGLFAVALTREQVSFAIGVFCAIPAIYASAAFIVSKAITLKAWLAKR